MVREQRRWRKKPWCGGRIQELGFNFYELIYYKGRRLNRVIISEPALMDSWGFLGNSGRVRNRNKLAELGAPELRSERRNSVLFVFHLNVCALNWEKVSAAKNIWNHCIKMVCALRPEHSEGKHLKISEKHSWAHTLRKRNEGPCDIYLLEQ